MPHTPLALRSLLALFLLLAAALAHAEPPSDADINRLLGASRAQNLLDSMMSQMEAMQQQQFKQYSAGRTLTAEQSGQLDKIQAKTSTILRKSLSWQEMRPLYISAYKQSFTREDVIAMAEFYESPAGQRLLDKTPVLMQNVMQAVQQKMSPLLGELEKELNQITRESTPPQR